MRIPFKPLLVVLCVTGCVAPALSMADTNDSNTAMQPVKIIKKHHHHRHATSVAQPAPATSSSYANQLASDAAADQTAQSAHVTEYKQYKCYI